MCQCVSPIRSRGTYISRFVFVIIHDQSSVHSHPLYFPLRHREPVPTERAPGAGRVRSSGSPPTGGSHKLIRATATRACLELARMPAGRALEALQSAFNLPIAWGTRHAQRSPLATTSRGTLKRCLVPQNAGLAATARMSSRHNGMVQLVVEMRAASCQPHGGLSTPAPDTTARTSLTGWLGCRP